MDGVSFDPTLDPVTSAFLADALAGLTAPSKSLSAKWLYDRRGSELFEQITALPEYHVTRTETAILHDHATELAARVAPGGALVELGSGASVKTRLLLDAGTHFGAYVPIDISADFLHATAADLRTHYPSLPIYPVVRDFTGFVELPDAVSDRPKVGFFPGSTIGNMPVSVAQGLLSNARANLGMDTFLLGVDLVNRPANMVAAYDDSQGVTAAFVRNILTRLNRDLGAQFDLESFAYEAIWNEADAQIEMRLVSRHAQTILLAGTEIHFDAREPIDVSTSRKFTPARLADLVGPAGWRTETLLTDPQTRFGVAVLVPNSN